MASNFLHATDLGSDTDDEDYVPDTKEVQGLSEEDDEETHTQNGSKTKKATKKATKGTFGKLQPDSETQAMKEEFKKEEQEVKELIEKKKVDDLWADFKKDVSSKVKPKTGGSGLGALMGGKPLTNTVTTSSKPIAKPVSLLSSIFDKPSQTEANSQEVNDDSKKDDKTMTITKVFDFAGEQVSITKDVDKDSKEAKKFLSDSEKAEEAKKRQGGGLAGLVSTISGKKQKMGCLDKSKLDWNKFVEKEGIKEDLETHNKGKDGYVEKQQFLDRADYRRFELEKEAREKTRKTLNR